MLLGLPLAMKSSGRLWSTARTASIVLLALSGLACAARPKPPPYAPPDAAVTVRYFPGSTLSGPVSQPSVSDVPGDALSIRIQLISLQTAPISSELQPIGSRVSLIAMTRGGSAVLAEPEMTRGAAIAPPEGANGFVDKLSHGALGVSAPIREVSLALPRGTTGQVELVDPVAPLDPLSGSPTHPRLVLSLSFPPAASGAAGPPASLGLGLVARKKIAPDSGASSAGGTGLPGFQQETVLLDPFPLARPIRFALVVPFTFVGHRSWGVGIVIEAAMGSDNAKFQQILSQSVAQARTASRDATQPAYPSTLPSTGPSELAGAVSLLEAPDRQRRSLVFLAGQTGARICRDAALSADPTTLAAICKRVAAPAASLTHDPGAIAWLLDRQTLALLSEMGDAGTLPPELMAVLVIHAGEVGRHPATIQDVLKAAGDETTLTVRLTSENLLYLEDSSPASRARAFEWLSARGSAPRGYDPLGSSRERRAAIDRALAPPAEPVSQEADHE